LWTRGFDVFASLTRDHYFGCFDGLWQLWRSGFDPVFVAALQVARLFIAATTLECLAIHDAGHARHVVLFFWPSI
jgi:hypothetical protein